MESFKLINSSRHVCLSPYTCERILALVFFNRMFIDNNIKSAVILLNRFLTQVAPNRNHIQDHIIFQTKIPSITHAQLFDHLPGVHVMAKRKEETVGVGGSVPKVFNNSNYVGCTGDAVQKVCRF